MTGYLILGISYAFAAAVQPGPFQAYLISRTLADGLKRSFPAAFAPLISDGPIIALVLLVLSRMPGWLVQALQIAGGFFLMYLAIGAYRSWRSYDPEKTILTGSGRQTVFKAALINLLNPAPYLAWSLVMGPLLLKGWQEAPANGLALLAGFYLMLISGTIGIMALFAAARQFGPRLTRALIGLSVLVLGGFGLYELWSGLGGLLA
jgi:threonine/homoserine/homoserine lactone efflux protein